MSDDNNDMSTIGERLKISVYGASHAEKIGVIISGFPHGFSIDFNDIAVQMARRAPGNIQYSTARKEPDLPQILCGVDENGVTDGGDIEAVIYNTNQHSNDYNSLKNTPRPAHADYTAHVKFSGRLDMRGGGKFSGRLTAPIVFAGALCAEWLRERGITIASHVASLGGVSDQPLDPVCPDEELLSELHITPFPVIDSDVKSKMIAVMDENRRALDSVGGRVECVACGVPAGLGDSLFDGFDGRLAKYLFGIPAVKGVEFGAGFYSCELHGSENNDAFAVKDGKVVTLTNHCGGILGGITNGMPIIFTTGFKPTPSIARVQKTVDLSTMTDTEIQIKGRHDPCVVPRAAAVVEAVTALCLMDTMLCERSED